MKQLKDILGRSHAGFISRPQLLFRSLVAAVCIFFLAAAGIQAEEALQDSSVLRVNFTPQTIQWDPHHSYTSLEAQIYTAVYEGLTTYNPRNLNPEPGTAESWQVSDDRTVITFLIRKDAMFWDGTPVTAETIKESWLALLSPETDAEYSFLLDPIRGAQDYRTGKIKDPNQVGVTAVDKQTLKVELANPAPHFLKMLSHHSTVPVHPALLEQNNWEDAEIIGNGPFVLTDRQADSLTFRKSTKYWDRANVKAEALTISFNTDTASVTSRFNKETLHWTDTAIDFGRLQIQDALVVNPLFATSYFFIAAGKEPFDDPNVRRALALLLPWKDIRTEERFHLPTNRLIPSIPLYPDIEGIDSSNPEQALTLLKEAGYPKGEGLPEIVIAVPPGVTSQEVAGIMKESWEANLDTTVTITSHQFPEYYQVLKGDTYTVGTMTWIGDYADPLSFLQMWTQDSNLNDGNYANPDYDTLIAESMSLYGDNRYNVMGQAEQMLLQDAVVLPIANMPAFNIVNIHIVDGWYANSLDIHPFKYMAVTPPGIPPGVAMAPF